jgi:putative Holliday junction resolvase
MARKAPGRITPSWEPQIYNPDMRVLGVDLGQKRVGLAISDASGLLARPLTTLTVTGAADALKQVMREIERIAGEEDGLSEIVVGVPARLDGSVHAGTADARSFIEALRRQTPLPIGQQDERLTSREAESRLALRQRDWRKRKAGLDAAAAAVILQDYLDRQHA